MTLQLLQYYPSREVTTLAEDLLKSLANLDEMLKGMEKEKLLDPQKVRRNSLKKSVLIVLRTALMFMWPKTA